MTIFDPPRHTAIRTLVNRLFTPARLKEITPRLEAIATELVDAFIDDGEVEFVTAFSSLYPFLVINELFGIPAPDRARMRELYKSRSRPTAGDPQSNLAAMRTVVRGEDGGPPPGMSPLNQQFLAYMSERRANPHRRLGPGAAARRPGTRRSES